MMNAIVGDTVLTRRKDRPLFGAWVDDRPVSLWQMFSVNPIQLAKFFEGFEGLRQLLQSSPSDFQHRERAANALRNFGQDLEKLVDSGALSRRARSLADRIEEGATECIAGRMAEFMDSVQGELEGRLFFGMTEEETRLYTEPDFPEKVADRFPSASQEIAEASRCLALDLPTASAFHSVRALEVLLNAILNELGLDRPPNWYKALSKIEKEIKDRRNSSDPRDSSWGKEWGDFYAELASHFLHLKNAQRNPTVHWTAQVIDTKRARQMRTHTIQLIETASEHLSETCSTLSSQPSGQSPDDAQG